MKSIIFGIMILLILGCTGPLYKNPRGAEFCAEVDKLCSQVTSRLEKRFNLHLTGSGGNCGQGIKELSKYYQSKHIVKIDEARKIVLAAIKEYEDAINQDDSIRPYLIEYPFDIKRLDLNLSFHDMPMKLYGSEYVSRVLFF